MTICFTALTTNLSNTGGNRTIIRSVDELRKQGNDVSVVARKDRYTWDEHKTVLKSIPKSDVNIAVSVLDIKNTINSKSKRKFIWMRGVENWFWPEDKILRRLDKFINQGGRILVNSSWLKTYLIRKNLESTLCYSGLDINTIHSPRTEGRVRIGCLYHKTHKTKGWHLFRRLADILGYDNYEYAGFGVGRPKECDWLTRYHNDPSPEKKDALFKSCNIWFSPTFWEGFHSVPAEANLMGCLVVCSNSESNGLSDYCNSDTSMVYSTLTEAADMCRNPEYNRVERMQYRLMNKIGTRKENMRKFVKEISR